MEGKISKQACPALSYSFKWYFDLREYEFTRLEVYNSIQYYSIRNIPFKKAYCQGRYGGSFITYARMIEEPEVPFPQADSFERVLNLCELLKQQGFISKEDITSNYDFDHRQTDYYSNA